MPSNLDRRTYVIDWRPLREQRQAMHISQRALADAVGVTSMTIWRIENGRHRPTVDIAMAICRALGVPITKLMLIDKVEP